MPGARGAVLAVLLRTGAGLTGRRIHALAGSHSLGAVQQALRDLERIGVITTETIGRAGVHRINETHEAIAPLRSLASPIEMLTRVVRATAPDVEAVIVFGSVARGEPRADSDIDLLIVRPDATDPEDESWRGQLDDLASSVATWTGNDAQVLEYSATEVVEAQRGRSERVLRDIAAEGITVFGPERYLQRAGTRR